MPENQAKAQARAAARLANSVAFVISEVIYPQLLEELKESGMVTASAGAVFSSRACPLIKIRIQATAFEFEPWDLSKNCVAAEFGDTLAQDERMETIITPLLAETHAQTEANCWYCVEEKPDEHLKVRLAVRLSRV